jgi:ribosomal protein L13E
VNLEVDNLIDTKGRIVKSDARGSFNLVRGFTIKELSQEQDITLNIKGSDLNEGNNSLILKVIYTDKIGRGYLIEEIILIGLEKVSFFQKIMIGLNRINKFIESIFI